MQLIKFATFTALIMTVSAAVPGAIHLRDDVDDPVELFERASCSNIANIKRPNKYEKEGCVPEKSRGFLSSHNCANKGGTAYMCVQGGKSFCVSGKAALKKGNYENGECFV